MQSIIRKSDENDRFKRIAHGFRSGLDGQNFQRIISQQIRTSALKADASTTESLRSDGLVGALKV
ncbi:unnamed protein product, partial [Nesidiocoris tenuis]